MLPCEEVVGYSKGYYIVSEALWRGGVTSMEKTSNVAVYTGEETAVSLGSRRVFFLPCPTLVVMQGVEPKSPLKSILALGGGERCYLVGLDVGTPRLTKRFQSGLQATDPLMAT